MSRWTRPGVDRRIWGSNQLNLLDGRSGQVGFQAHEGAAVRDRLHPHGAVPHRHPAYRYFRDADGDGVTANGFQRCSGNENCGWSSTSTYSVRSCPHGIVVIRKQLIQSLTKSRGLTAVLSYRVCIFHLEDFLVRHQPSIEIRAWAPGSEGGRLRLGLRRLVRLAAGCHAGLRRVRRSTVQLPLRRAPKVRIDPISYRFATRHVTAHIRERLAKSCNISVSCSCDF